MSGFNSGRTSRRGFGSGPPTNLTTPMESVRSSTHSLVGRNRGRRPGWWRRCFGRSYACLATLPKLTLSQLGERYYAPLLLRNSVRVRTHNNLSFHNDILSLSLLADCSVGVFWRFDGSVGVWRHPSARRFRFR